jgi:hypothetical protein
MGIFSWWFGSSAVLPDHGVLVIRRNYKSVLAWSVSGGLVSAGILEILHAGLQLDLFLMLVLVVAITYPDFPSNSVRAQLILSLYTLGSFGWDLFVLIRRINTKSGRYSQGAIIAIQFFAVILMLCKGHIFWEFLLNVKGSARVRKYMHRRFRLFLFPFEQPKRIMRDIRGRYLALAWLHVISFLMLITLWVVLVFGLDYYVYFLTGFSTKYLSWFLAGKAFTTLLCIFGLWYDIDVCLCLSHFGCCVFTMPAIRRYIRQRRAVLGGYPLAVSFFSFRFQLWQILKSVDILVGIGLWIILVLNAGSQQEVEASMYIYLGSLGFVLIVSDVWSLLIIAGIRWLWSRHKMLQRIPESLRAEIPSAQASVNSDDSELDDFNLRCPNPIAVEKSSARSKAGEGKKGKVDPSTVNIRKHPTSMSALMNAFLFPGKYLQDDGEMQADSDSSDNDSRAGDTPLLPQNVKKNKRRPAKKNATGSASRKPKQANPMIDPSDIEIGSLRKKPVWTDENQPYLDIEKDRSVEPSQLLSILSGQLNSHQVKKSKILPVVQPTDQGDVGHEEQDRKGHEDEEDDLSTLLDQEDSQLYSTRRRMKQSNEVQEWTGHEDEEDELNTLLEQEDSQLYNARCRMKQSNEVQEWKGHEDEEDGLNTLLEQGDSQLYNTRRRMKQYIEPEEKAG